MIFNRTYGSISALIISMMLHTCLAQAQPIDITISSFTPPVFYQAFNDQEFKPLNKNYQPKEGDLLKVDKNGKIEIVYMDRDKNKEVSRVLVEEPYVFRLGTNEFKEFTYQEFDLSYLQPLDKNIDTSDVSSFLNDFFFSFRRTVFSPLAHSESLKRLFDGHEVRGTAEGHDKQEILFRNHINKINLLYPQEEMFYFLDYGFASIPILWEGVISDKAIKYRIFVWKKNEEIGESTAETLSTSYILNLKDPGSYYVQVISGDQQWRSVPRIFHVYEKENKNKLSKVLGKNFEKSAFFTQLAPQANIVLLRTKPSYKITFAWRMQKQDVSQFNSEYKITIMNKDGLVKEVITPEQQIDIELADGSYHWFLQWMGKKWENLGGYNMGYSAINTFELLTVDQSSRKSFPRKDGYRVFQALE
jgi:hypothetical protein